MHWLSGMLLLFGLLACTNPVQTAPQPQPPAASRLVFDCECLDITVDLSDGEARIELPELQLALPRVPAGSGAKYRKAGYTFWTKGEQARLETPDEVYPNCRVDRRRTLWADAWQRGVSFRASGQEPGWHLEITPQTIMAVLDYGSRTLHFATPIPQHDPQTAVTRYTASAAEHSLELLIEDGSCQDSMSGETFTARVTLTIDGRSYRGCGRSAERGND